jgi:N-methylhydantoinase A
MTIARGFDPRDFALLAYGAAGPMHAVAVARELGISEVVVPYFPGGFSAFGMVSSRSRVEYSQSVYQPLTAFGAEGLNRLAAELEARCREDLEAQGIPAEDTTITYAFYGMYAGQGQDNRQPLPPPPYDDTQLERIAADFHDFYERRYGYRAPEIPILVTSVSVVGFGPVPQVTLPPTETSDDGTGPERAIVMRATMNLDRQECPDAGIYDRNKLREGDEVAGPAVIDDQLGTIVVNPGATARVGRYGTLTIEV